MLRTQLAAALSCALFAAVVAGSCRGVVAGDSVDAVQDLCTLLVGCYGDEYDCTALAARVDGYTPKGGTDARAEFLKSFEAAGCTENCAKAKLCLDGPLFCGREACAHDYDCCDWSQGIIACGDEGTAHAGTCCLPNGIACGGDAECCDARCENGSCGGYSCTLVGDPCASNTECCTGFCDGAVCTIKDCVDPGGECTTDGDCCEVQAVADGPQTAATCVDHKCIFDVPCREEGMQCDDAAGLSCCGDTPLACIPDDMGIGICGMPGCVGQGLPCMGLDCCEGFCNISTGLCAPAVDCTPDGAGCMDATECCSGACLMGFCFTPICDLSCHDVCQFGAALDASCGSDPMTANCIAEVVDVDSFCGCNGWDYQCRTEFDQFCPDLCPPLQ